MIPAATAFEGSTSMPRSPQHLSRRERQIMDIVYRLGQATVAEVLQAMPDPPGYSAVRALLRVLEEKGHLRHQEQGRRYVFQPTVKRDKARNSALRQLLDTFFEGSAEQMVVALLDVADDRLSDEQRQRLAQLIAQAKQEGR